jgi:hypothetical protein
MQGCRAFVLTASCTADSPGQIRVTSLSFAVCRPERRFKRSRGKLMAYAADD